MNDRFTNVIKKAIPLVILGILVIFYFRLQNINSNDYRDLTDEEVVFVIEEDGYYYDYENVILYLDTYGRLPNNYITKSKAKKLGWEGGSVEDFYPGGAIGGGRFGNNEGILPDDDGIEYFECDIDTEGKSSRGAKRVVYSNEPKYYYTTNHYETFERYEVVDGRVIKVD